MSSANFFGLLLILVSFLFDCGNESISIDFSQSDIPNTTAEVSGMSRREDCGRRAGASLKIYF